MEELLKICPVFGYDILEEIPYSDNKGSNPSYEVCSCCEYEFGYDDSNCNKTFEEYKRNWIKIGYVFFLNEDKPMIWNEDAMKQQLLNVKKTKYKPRIFNNHKK